MNVDTYTDKLDLMDAKGISGELLKSLSCPLDWSMEPSIVPIIPMLYEKWFYAVSDHLPDGETDLQYLRGDGESFLGTPSIESFDWCQLVGDVSATSPAALDQARRLASCTFSKRDSYRQQYESDCSRLLGMRAQRYEDYPKHYAIGAKTCLDVNNLSLTSGKRDVGILLPSLTPRVQEYAFWLAVADLFERQMMELEEKSEYDAPHDSRRKHFDRVWAAHLGNPQSFRISLDAMTKVGFQNGLVANWLIFDASLQSKVIHCYPAVVPIHGLPEAAVDNLQGLAECFEKGVEFPIQ